MDSSTEKFSRIFHAGCYRDLLQLSDAKLKTEDGCTFDIHRILLAKSSNYFRAMFCGINEHRKDFTIPGIPGWCLGEILSYIYTSDISVTEQNITDLLIACDYLLLTDLYRVIKGRVKDTITAANCLRLYQAAYDVNDEYLSSQSLRFIQTRFEDIARSQKRELVGLPLVILRKILSDRSLCVVGESSIWQIIIEWTKEDLKNRYMYFPHLLNLLARKDLDETLASEILQHEIVTKNALLKDFLQKGCGKEFSTNLEIFLGIVKNREGIDYRIPESLWVITAHTIDRERGALYVTYDEKLDLWRNVEEINFQPDYMVPVGSTVIFFSITNLDCKKFDLINQQWTPMARFRCTSFSVVEIESQIFVFGTIYFSFDHWTFGFELYDAERDIWHHAVPLEYIINAVAVALSRKIYVVGNTLYGHEMAAFVLDIDSWEWIPLPPPNFFRKDFALVALHDSLYLIGGSDSPEDISKVEVFEPETAKWRELPELPHTYSKVRATVWKNRIIVIDEQEEGWNASSKDVRWNEEKYCWESKHSWESTVVDFHGHRFCKLCDVDTIRFITRKNRNPNTTLQRSYFST